MNENTVTIRQERYEELLDSETRVDVLLDVIRAEKFIAIKDIFRILGCTQDVRRIEAKEREELIRDEGEE